MEVYLIRHGETIWNKKALLCGRTDIPLTEKGRYQARVLAEQIKKVNVDLILSSPLQRTMQTAEVISLYVGVPVLTEPLLLEHDFGILEGHPMVDEECLKYRENFFCPFPGGESVVSVAHRALKLIEIMKEKYYGQKILLVSHGAFCRVFHSCIEGVLNERYYQISFENCQLQKYEI